MYLQVLAFWFEEITPAQRWVKDESFDQLILDRFSTLHTQASQCELYEWRKTAKGRLAEIIVLDQFSRNMFRNSPQSFAYDSLALALSQEAIALKAEAELTAEERSFLYMPFMHSESLAIHQIATTLFEENGIESNYHYEIRHKEIIERFGRYPHRNKILGRESTEEEIQFLMEPGSGF
ncbi:MAG: hypothetical protein COA99_18935 [Moraxellaceae bacterium]|nr:MAG: hypothetical protein COA99_18935 [Moraxellaceae bacterium]